MIGEYFTMAVKNVRKRKLRSLLTLLGILIAISTIFMLISISLGLQNAVEEQFRLLGSDKIFIQPRGQLAGPGTGGAVSLTQKDVDAVKKISGVKETTWWVASSAKVEFKDDIRFVQVAGLDMDTIDLFREIGNYKIQEGRMLDKGDSGEVMLGSQYKDKVFGREMKAGDTILINDREFKVRGILESVGNPQDDRLIYMPSEDFRALFNIPERIDMIVVQVEEGQDIEEAADRIDRRLMKSRDVTEDTKDYTILTPEELLESIGVILNILTGFLVGIAAISLLVGGIGIANTMFTSVLERTREIGVMKAIGAQNKDILLIFLIEAGLLGLVGGILGVLGGAVVSKAIEYYAVTALGTNLLRAAIPIYLVAGCLLFAFAVGAISGFFPAWNAAKIKPVQALRYE